MNEKEAGKMALDGVVMRAEHPTKWNVWVELRCLEGKWQVQGDQNAPWFDTSHPFANQGGSWLDGFDGWEPVHEDGTIKWAQGLAKEGKLLRRTPFTPNVYNGWDDKGFYIAVWGEERRYGTAAIENTVGAPTGWSIYEPPVESTPPDEDSVIGVKFLTKEGMSPWAGTRKCFGSGVGAKPVHYPVGEWIEVWGNGCYLGIREGFNDGGSLLAAGIIKPREDLVVAYFEGREDIGGMVTLRRYRWVKRLVEPCPERMPPAFHDWIRQWKDKFTPEQLKALLPKEEETKVERLKVERGGMFVSPHVYLDGAPILIRELDPDHVGGYVNEMPNGKELFSDLLCSVWCRLVNNEWRQAVAPDITNLSTDDQLAKLKYVLWVK